MLSDKYNIVVEPTLHESMTKSMEIAAFEAPRAFWKYRTMDNWSNNKKKTVSTFYFDDDVEDLVFDDQFIVACARRNVVLFDAASGKMLDPILVQENPVKRVRLTDDSLICATIRG